MKMMKWLVMGVMLASVANADLVQNPSFDDGGTNWNNAGPWGNSFYTDGPDTIVALGGWGNGVDWSNASLWQDTGATFAADTVYTLSATWRDTSGNPPVDNIRLTVQDVSTGWSIVAGQVFSVHNGTNWYTSSLMFDTASNPSVVGDLIGVGFELTTATAGTWVHVDSISMIPEPGTVALLGIGSMALLATRRFRI